VNFGAGVVVLSIGRVRGQSEVKIQVEGERRAGLKRVAAAPPEGVKDEVSNFLRGRTRNRRRRSGTLDDR
jgi:hypothetical protein